MARSLEERVGLIEKVFWAVGAVAVVFGVSDAWGYKLLADAATEIGNTKAAVEVLPSKSPCRGTRLLRMDHERMHAPAASGERT